MRGYLFDISLVSSIIKREREKEDGTPIKSSHFLPSSFFPTPFVHAWLSPAVSHQRKKRRNEGWQKRVSSSSFHHQHQALFLLLCPRRDVTNSPSCQEARRQKKQYCSIRGKRVSQFYAPIAKKISTYVNLKKYVAENTCCPINGFAIQSGNWKLLFYFFKTRAPFYRVLGNHGRCLPATEIDNFLPFPFISWALCFLLLDFLWFKKTGLR